MFKRYYQHYGRILHLDGDRKYSEKSQKVYKSMGLNVIVKNIPESKQPQMIWGLLGKYNPDILVVTGHDGMIKKGYNFNDIYNYRNSKYFVEIGYNEPECGSKELINLLFLQELARAIMKL